MTTICYPFHLSKNTCEIKTSLMPEWEFLVFILNIPDDYNWSTGALSSIINNYWGKCNWIWCTYNSNYANFGYAKNHTKAALKVHNDVNLCILNNLF